MHPSLKRNISLFAFEAGSTLITVLWITLLVSVLLAGVIAATRVEIRIAANQLEQFFAQQAIDNALQRIIVQFASRQAISAVQLRSAEYNYGEYKTVLQEIADEGAKFDLNTTNENDFVQMLESAGVEHNIAVGYSARILDWRDADTLRRSEGAEDMDYLRADHPAPGNRPFYMVAEINRVLNVSLPSVECVSRLFTVQGRGQTINTNTISPQPGKNTENNAPQENKPKTAPSNDIFDRIAASGRKLAVTLNALRGEKQVLSKTFVILGTGRSNEPVLVLSMQPYYDACQK